MSFPRPNLLALAAAGGAVLAAGASPASANVEFGVTAGPHMFSPNNELGVADRSDATSLRNSVLFGLRLGFGFNDMIGIEAEAGAIPSEGRNLVFDVWTAVYRAHIIAQFGADDPSKKLIPFVVLGAGAITVTESDNETVISKDTDPEFYVGIGVKYRVDNGWGLRFDLRGIGVPSSEAEYVPSESHTPLAFDAEALLSVYKEFGRDEIVKIVKEEPIEEEPPVADADSDGILDPDDQCVNEPEDADGWQDSDGCPDTDNDGDTVMDEQDNCDADDAPTNKEDLDGYQDEDGCPENDNDGDKILDADDQCAMNPEDPDGFNDEDGCPDPDNDEDGVLDADDKCPDSKESHNGYQDTDGCDDTIPKAVQKFTGVIKGINFKNDSAEILKSSNKVLDAAVKLLTEYKDLRLEIQGHTDDTGTPERNRELSQLRAESVKAYFVKKGIDEGRLEAKGYANDVPLVNKKTKAARAKNRRVEFKLISSLDAAAPAPATDDGM
jgi:outer membrane protein OmpA-like peptidoglycan-associated protein